MVFLAFALCASGLVLAGLGDCCIIPTWFVRSTVKDRECFPVSRFIKICTEKYFFVRWGFAPHVPRCHQKNHEEPTQVSTRKPDFLEKAPRAPSVMPSGVLSAPS